MSDHTTDHLLPDNASPLERTLSLAAARMLDIPVPIRPLWRPAEIQENEIPWLAWAMDVGSWESTWPVDLKRQVMINSPEEHRHRGTRYALDLAMQSLGMQLEVHEWFEYGGQPYTFRIKVHADNTDPWGLPEARLIYRTAIRAKNVRSYLDKVQVVRYTQMGEFKLVGFVMSHTNIVIRPAVVDKVTPTNCPLYIGGVVQTHTNIVIKPRGA